MLKINIIGAGNVGKTLAKLITLHQAGSIASVYNRSLLEAEKSIAFIGEGVATASLDNLGIADITFITTPDDRIQETSERLLQCNSFQPNHIFVHCSGTKTADILATKNYTAINVHPLKSFSDPATAADSFSGTYCSIEESSSPSLSMIKTLFEKIGAKIFFISKNKKALYHAGSVFASNYLVTLYQNARECFESSGIDDSIAHEIVHSFFQGALDNIALLKNAKAALTGPIQRADLETITAHTIALLNENTDMKTLYQVLGKATAQLTSHDDSIKKMLNALLSS